jgi:hypothetical protein
MGSQARIGHLTEMVRGLRETQGWHDETHRDERERLMHHLVTMRRAGFLPVAESDSEDGIESWVLDNAHEAEVSERRRQDGVSDGERDEIRGVMLDGIRGVPLA